MDDNTDLMERIISAAAALTGTGTEQLRENWRQALELSGNDRTKALIAFLAAEVYGKEARA